MSRSELQLVIDEMRAFAAPRRRMSATWSDIANLVDGWADRIEDQLPEPPAPTFEGELAKVYDKRTV